MATPKRTSIGLEREEYEILKDLKEEAERRVNASFDWGSFVVGCITGGVLAAVVAEIVKEKKIKRGGR